MPTSLTTHLRCLTLPGWMNSDATHWQSQWEALHGFERLQQDDWQWPRRGDWMARLEEALLLDQRPAVLIAHSLGCHLVAAWAAHTQHKARVKGAFLVAPPDLDRADLPPQLVNWQPAVSTSLPFASVLVASSNDTYCTPERAVQIARNWGSDCVAVGAQGHINGTSNLGAWHSGWTLFEAWLQKLNSSPVN
jgi:uncharacterized protein